MSNRLRIAVLISGGGTTLANLIRCIQAGSLPAYIECVVSSRTNVRGVHIARDAGLDVSICRPVDFDSPETFSEAVFNEFRKREVDLAVMAGFLCFLPIPDDYLHRVVNIHPALIPAFCGKGYHGLHVHEAVLRYGCKISGCTVHFVDNEYDHGPIIAQSAVEVLDADTPEALAARVFAAECEIYPKALKWIAEGRLRVNGRKVEFRRMPGSAI